MTTTAAAPARTFTVSPVEALLTQDKIEKINARAAKRGFTGRITLTLGPIVNRTIDLNGFKVVESVREMTLGGEAPSYEGWTFVAALDQDPHAGLVVRTAPGVESVDRSSIREGFCAHCGIERARKVTYLVRNDETGAQVQVGSTCIKDFLGWSGQPVFLSIDEVEGEIEDALTGAFGHHDRAYHVESTLAVAWAAVTTFGYVRSGEIGATREVVEDFLSGKGRKADEIRAALSDKAEAAGAKAAEIRAYLLSDQFNGGSEYVLNMKSILGAEFASPRNLGLLVSAPQAFAKAMEFSLIRKAEQAARVEAFIGTVGEKITVTGTVTGIRWVETQYGTSTLYTITTDQGTVKWFASRPALGEDQGVKVTITATVKKHEEYQGHKATMVTRAKAL